MNRSSAVVDGQAIAVSQRPGIEEFRAYLRAIGSVIAEMLLEIMNPMYAEHLALMPAQNELNLPVEGLGSRA